MQNAPRRFQAIKLLAFISTGQFGSHAMASYNSQSPNLCVKSILLNGKSNDLVKHDVTNALEALQLMAASTVKCNCTVAKILALYRDENAFHIVFNNPLITDLDCLVQKDESTVSKLPYIAASIINALDYLHRIGIVYRSIQPESIHVDNQGRIVLIDFEICKIAGVGKKSYTVCGVPDYLAPEQISQQGHNEAVDFWSLGVLLYELACHENPFSCGEANEVQIFSKITSLGHESLPVNPALPAPLMDLIKRLVVPTPAARLGMGAENMASLKTHDFFSSVRFDADFLALSSPLRNFAAAAKQENLDTTDDLTAVSAKWNQKIANSQWADHLLMD
jgi:cGMP-dependent protein kinase 1